QRITADENTCAQKRNFRVEKVFRLGDTAGLVGACFTLSICAFPIYSFDG
ncbi:MAG: hypothetical protein GYA46_05745, partial [candidate division Zixibacteria bacterium]|nr:hypothetical protein [candidate division Zixibacteria bacterium]